MIDPVHAPRLAETVAAELERLILEGVLRPGERLAGERELAERLGVSRPSLREALQLLEQRGLLVTGRTGSVVARFLAPMTDPLATLFTLDPRVAEDFFEYRGAVEVKAAMLAAERASEPERAAIRAVIARMEAAPEDCAAEAEADLEFHALIHEASHNLVMLHVMRGLAELLRRDIFFSRQRMFSRREMADALMVQHRAIAAAILDRDSAAAGAAMADHIRYTFQAMEDLRRAETRESVALRRFSRSDLVAG
ncbi:FadR/GntR family transcriptional regulator [Segnochrobactraceae bacterium EtOH-i3]